MVLVHRVWRLYGAIAGIYDYLATCSPFAATETVIINGARAVGKLYPTCNISGRNRVGRVGFCARQNMKNWPKGYAVLEQRVQEKATGLEHKTRFSFFVASQPPTAFTGSLYVSVFHRYWDGLQI